MQRAKGGVEFPAFSFCEMPVRLADAQSCIGRTRAEESPYGCELLRAAKTVGHMRLSRPEGCCPPREVQTVRLQALGGFNHRIERDHAAPIGLHHQRIDFDGGDDAFMLRRQDRQAGNRLSKGLDVMTRAAAIAGE